MGWVLSTHPTLEEEGVPSALLLTSPRRVEQGKKTFGSSTSFQSSWPGLLLSDWPTKLPGGSLPPDGQRNKLHNPPVSHHSLTICFYLENKIYLTRIQFYIHTVCVSQIKALVKKCLLPYLSADSTDFLPPGVRESPLPGSPSFFVVCFLLRETVILLFSIVRLVILVLVSKLK